MPLPSQKHRRLHLENYLQPRHYLHNSDSRITGLGSQTFSLHSGVTREIIGTLQDRSGWGTNVSRNGGV